MLEPIANHEFCIVGNGKKIHVQVSGTSRNRKPLCGAVKRCGRGMVVSVQSTFVHTPDEINRMIDNGHYTLCPSCAKLTTTK
jgi:hypothetical protein